MRSGARPRLRHETDTARLCINELLKVSSDDVISWPIRKRRSYCFISTPKIQPLRFCSSRCYANLSRDLSILSFWHLVHFKSFVFLISFFLYSSSVFYTFRLIQFYYRAISYISMKPNVESDRIGNSTVYTHVNPT